MFGLFSAIRMNFHFMLVSIIDQYLWFPWAGWTFCSTLDYIMRNGRTVDVRCDTTLQWSASVACEVCRQEIKLTTVCLFVCLFVGTLHRHEKPPAFCGLCIQYTSHDIKCYVDSRHQFSWDLDCRIIYCHIRSTLAPSTGARRSLTDSLFLWFSFWAKLYLLLRWTYKLDFKTLSVSSNWSVAISACVNVWNTEAYEVRSCIELRITSSAGNGCNQPLNH